MREIKFRAWDAEAREMLGPFASGCELAGDGFDSEWILMQYTGLKDKNGREIYEGDILNDGGRLNNEVIYEAPCFDLNGYDNGDYYVGGCPNFHDWDSMIVLGNIHENPELLNA